MRINIFFSLFFLLSFCSNRNSVRYLIVPYCICDRYDPTHEQKFVFRRRRRQFEFEIFQREYMGLETSIQYWI